MVPPECAASVLRGWRPPPPGRPEHARGGCVTRHSRLTQLDGNSHEEGCSRHNRGWRRGLHELSWVRALLFLRRERLRNHEPIETQPLVELVAQQFTVAELTRV